MNDKKISGASTEPRIDEIILPDGVKADYTSDAPHNSLVGINPPAVDREILEQLSKYRRTNYRGIDELANYGMPRHI
jgi:hypothetical protein